jgi:plastocyanin
MASRKVFLALLLSAGTVACSAGPSRPANTPKPAARVASPAASPGASPAATESGQPRKVGDITYADFGSRDVHDKTSQDLDAGDFYFKGTFLEGNPGQKLKLRIRNTAQAAHNFSLPAQGIDQQIPPGGSRVEVDVTLPESGALRFFCKLHAERGMNGQLLGGVTEPQPVAGEPGLPSG